MDFEKEIEQIKIRNQNVESDKAWERSWTRRLFILISTYIVAAIWLVTIKDTNPLFKALVPSAGYLLSTLSVPWVKTVWIKERKK